MWSTIDRARRRLDRGASGTSTPAPETTAAQEPDTPAPAPPRKLEDVVIVFGPAELDHLRVALEHALGDAVERPDTPARIERALSLLLARRGAPGRPRVLRRPAGCLDAGILGDPPRRRRARDRDGGSGRRAHRAVPRMIGTACLQCGTPSDNARGAFCRRCGLPYGEPPRPTAELPSCPICYRTVDDDGRLPSLERPATRVDLVRHRAEHDRHPVGDDDWLDSLRSGDQIRVGRWSAPFETVRRYLVTGQVEAGRNRRSPTTRS